MFRRTFLKSIGASALFASLPTSFKLHAGSADYNGKFVITVAADGGWDVSAFCDPKVNIAGEPEISHWTNNGEVEQAGNIRYAGVANNQQFFQKYYQDMMVINGVDAQTNSHTTGVINSWSGRLADGFPSLTALFASINAPNLPMTYINNGGYNRTAGLTRFTRLEDANALLDIISPNNVKFPWNDYEEYRIHSSDWNRVQALRNKKLSEFLAQEHNTVKQLKGMSDYQSAIANSSSLVDFKNTLKSAGDAPESTWDNSLKKQAFLALNAMVSKVTVSADLLIGGYDTHDRHDELQYPLLGELTDGIDYIWDYAEQLGIAERLVVVVGSDFSRTPFYNDNAGKDHWPIGSYMVMEKDAPWTNRTIGLTDEVQNVIPISPDNFSESSSGNIIYPKDVMHNLRQYLNLNGHDNAQSFQFNDANAFDFFSV